MSCLGRLRVILLLLRGDLLVLHYYLVSYDVSDPKRLRLVNRVLKGFGEGLHYSVFRCDLSRRGRVELVAAIEEVINHAEDRVFIVDLGPVDGSVEGRIIFMGKKDERRKRGAVIV